MKTEFRIEPDEIKNHLKEYLSKEEEDGIFLINSLGRCKFKEGLDYYSGIYYSFTIECLDVKEEPKEYLLREIYDNDWSVIWTAVPIDETYDKRNILTYITEKSNEDKLFYVMSIRNMTTALSFTKDEIEDIKENL